jgi:uncharacterized protein (TIGR03083 family)
MTADGLSAVPVRVQCMARAELNYLNHLIADSDRFLEVLQRTAPDVPVPSCPEWKADDLLFHLAEVQWFWARIVRDRITDGAVADELGCDRPDDRAGLEELFQRANRTLIEALRSTPPQTPTWTWAPEQSVGFILRRQAHEALIHRLDAELTAGSRTSLPAQLAADGVSEALTVIYGEPPPWSEFTPAPGAVIQFDSIDTLDSWLVTAGHFTGTSPTSGKHYEMACLDTAPPGSEPAAVVTGTAEDLDCWLWRRPPVFRIHTSGEPAALEKLNEAIGSGPQ